MVFDLDLQPFGCERRMFLRSVLNRSPISGGHPVLREAVMKTFYEFRSEADPDLHGFTDEVSGSKLPSENGPWTFIRQLASEGEWPSGISKAVTAAGVLENGFSLSNYRTAKPIIASDRVEGTAVYDPSGSRIGTIGPPSRAFPRRLRQ